LSRNWHKIKLDQNQVERVRVRVRVKLSRPRANRCKRMEQGNAYGSRDLEDIFTLFSYNIVQRNEVMGIPVSILT